VSTPVRTHLGSASRADVRRRRCRSAGRVFGIATWAVSIVGTIVGILLRAPEHAQALGVAVVIGLGCFFPLVILRLVVVAAATRRRRSALLALAGAITVYAVGAAVLQTQGPDVEQGLLSPSMFAFAIAYVGFAIFLLLDAPRRRGRALAVWLETTVVCAGTASLAGLVILTPLAEHFDGHGVRLLLALLYPLIDVVLAILVVGQLAAHRRLLDVRTVVLIVGLMILGVADSSFVLNVASESYAGSAAVDAGYGLAFACIVEAACLTRPWVPGPAMPTQRARTLIAAASVAVCVLVLHPAGAAGWYVVPPAVITLAAAGGRLMLALRESQGAAEALRLSRTDELTGLGNRRAVLASVDAGLRRGTPLALMLLDLDGFKDINDSLGHHAGDGVLTTVADRLIETVGPHDTVGRLGGDEFALVVRQEDPEALVEIARQVREMLLRPVRVESIELAIRASIGITVRQSSDETATDLLRRADVAMYEAKNTRSGALLYNAKHDGFSRERLLLAEELRQGIDKGQLVVWYQPQIDAQTHEIIAVEALVRWAHPQEGILPPIAFLPDARRSGLMLALTHDVMHSVVRDAAQWADEGLDLRVSMNCAPPELLGGALLPALFQAIKDADLPPNSLMVEVTEDSFVSDPEHARQTLHELRDHHVQTAIDDYGTGFSSLAYLRDLPVHELKMDRSFVSTIRTDARSLVIVESTSQMAHAMGLRLVAEGVEDAETADELARLGVDLLQGYHIARPMPAIEFGAWDRRWSASTALARREAIVY
jgi:diguanylate cyclase (GGDEF)-like protein